MKQGRIGNMQGMMPFPENMQANMMMYPNFMNDNYNVLENRLSALEKKVKTLENRISRLETPYQNNINQNYQTPQQIPYQATQNDTNNYNGEMYMM